MNNEGTAGLIGFSMGIVIMLALIILVQRASNPKIEFQEQFKRNIAFQVQCISLQGVK